SGGTSQPNLNTLVEALRFTARDAELAAEPLDAIAEYWRAVREFYAPFESPVLAAASDLYRHEMPGGQYTNLFEQARALGLADRWPDVCRMYADVNQMLGDIVKVTPTSKSVGDLALFLIANDLSTADVESGERELAFPQSVIDLLDGSMGQPLGGFPAKIRKRILGDRKPLRGRPGKTLPPADFAQTAEKLQGVLGRDPLRREVVSYLLYPQVYQEFAAHEQHYADTSVLPTPVFFYGMQPGEEISLEIDPGKTLEIRLQTLGETTEEGEAKVFFELNGQPRVIRVPNRAVKAKAPVRPKAAEGNPLHVGAPMPGAIAAVGVAAGQKVNAGDLLLTIEAMKMETGLRAERSGLIKAVHVHAGSQVEAKDLLIELQPAEG
ncbi:biotin/lipoyl-containing protein, partial [Aestuariivirga sp.]|uniref:biotin/lipoyl-containing protein n=1 Tax=Aestuariivirga sp. TaxID=2650926 RepID=UPI003593EBBF